MSADDRDVAWDDWPPTLEDPDAECFKWAWSEADSALVWRVSGPGDGRPFHEEQLLQAWGREPSPALGDLLGVATYAPTAGGERALVSIYAYFGAAVPADITRWFQQSFPDAQVRAQLES